MKSIQWLALSPVKVVRVLLVSFVLIAFGTACTEEAIVPRMPRVAETINP